MVWCEVWDDSGGTNAQFEILLHVDEEIVILAAGKTSVTSVVKRVTQ
jgi:hypothetical protein